MNIKLLDCTLRDGGYINNWNFGNKSITNILKKLIASSVEIIEIGFLDDRVKKDLNKTIMPNTNSINEILKKEDFSKGKSLILAMVDYGMCNIDNIEDSSKTFIDGIRVIFKKKDIAGALNYSRKLKDKGYKVCIQPVSITSYSISEFEELVKRVNILKPFAMSIVDTYGLMYKSELMKYFKIIKENLDKSIYKGYHSHNNLQMSLANCIELLNECENNDNIILDSTLYGMGKFAGNVNTELLSSYLNINYKKKYDINTILELIDEEIIKIYNKKQWGYNLYNYLSATNRCHPKYVKFLIDKNTLSVKEINNILGKLKNNLIFDENIITNIYNEYIGKK